jgi:uncharacterized MnhB-related membrane protein
MLQWFLDGILALALFWVAWQALTVTHLFQAIQWFIGFGFLLALTWARLSAVNLALAQVLLGGIITTFLFWKVLKKLNQEDREDFYYPSQTKETED